MRSYVSPCICSCAMHRFFFAWCASTHFMKIIAALVCAITAFPISLLKSSVILLEIIPSAECSDIDMKDIWKAVAKRSDALPSFANCWEHMVTKCRVFIWVQQSSNILIGTSILFTLCKFKGDWIMLIPFSCTVWVQLFSFSPLESFFLLCWCALKYSIWLEQYFPRRCSSLSCLGG